jgi:hypothetical protein
VITNKKALFADENPDGNNDESGIGTALPKLSRANTLPIL